MTDDERDWHEQILALLLEHSLNPHLPDDRAVMEALAMHLIACRENLRDVMHEHADLRGERDALAAQRDELLSDVDRLDYLRERAEARVAALERERDDTYKDRNFAVMLAAEIARRSRTVQVSVWVDQDAPDWPVLALALPTGQVSWHIAPQDFMSVFPIGGEWDGHTTSEKHARIRRYILNEEATDGA